MKRTVRCISILVLFAIYSFIPGSSHAAVPYYEGKTIDIVGESRVGGGTDTMARIIASIIPKHIPGHPKIVVRSLPGGGGTIANNVFYASGKPDGLHLIMNSSTPLVLQLQSRNIVKYDLTKLETIGNVSRGCNLLMVSKSAIKRLTDRNEKPVICGTQEGAEAWLAMTLWGSEFLGWNIRWIPGFSGTSDLELAFRRGETDMFATSNAYIIKRLLDEGLVVIVAQSGITRKNKVFRRPDFPDVPTFVEVLGGKKPEGIVWQAYRAWVGGNDDVDKFLQAPRNTPKKYVNILRKGFEEMGKDPQFDELMRRMVAEVYQVNVGQNTQDLLKEILSAPPAAIEYWANLQKKYGVIASK